MENKTTIDDLIETFTKRIDDSLKNERYIPEGTAELINALANLIEARTVRDNHIVGDLNPGVIIGEQDISEFKKRVNSKGMKNNTESKAITLNADVKGLDAVKTKAEELITLIEKAKSCVDDLAQAELEIKIYD